ncbi:MAG: 2-oxo acid dehydrogenase subunit E2 [Planctomycetota bacterium]|jgi:pyruvate dehydrogenase E2 component (dihydrolipoamide acetyltransferase)
MIEDIRLPEISENVKSGDVIEVLVKVGDFIEVEQPVVELETEKATFEVPSPVKGKIVEIKIKQGQTIKVGQLIVKVDTDAQAEEERAAPSVEITSEKKEQVTIEKTEERPQAAGISQEVKKEDFVVEPAEVKTGEKKPELQVGAVSAAPSARQLARELGIDLNNVRGTGLEGRISIDDIKRHVRNAIAGTTTPVVTGTSKALPDFSKWGNVEREPMTITRKKIAEILSYEWSNVPQVTQFDYADITDLEKFRRQYSDKVVEAGGKLTITSILLKVLASALKEFPKFNASLDKDRGEIIYKKYYNVSVAVDTDRGLLVPVIRDIDKKNMLQLSVELTKLSGKTRKHQISPEDMVGGNFTISNLGGIGGTNFTPIIYWPQTAILGVARSTHQPVYVNSQLERRLILPLSVSYDHRIIDGTEAVRFLRWIAEALEKPFLLATQE